MAGLRRTSRRRRFAARLRPRAAGRASGERSEAQGAGARPEARQRGLARWPEMATAAAHAELRARRVLARKLARGGRGSYGWANPSHHSAGDAPWAAGDGERRRRKRGYAEKLARGSAQAIERRRSFAGA